MDKMSTIKNQLKKYLYNYIKNLLLSSDLVRFVMEEDFKQIKLLIMSKKFEINLNNDEELSNPFLAELNKQKIKSFLNEASKKLNDIISLTENNKINEAEKLINDTENILKMAKQKLLNIKGTPTAEGTNISEESEPSTPAPALPPKNFGSNLYVCVLCAKECNSEN
ncbi:hypothetical protein Mgra_00005748 [Meloidogyne graminicola]|uniref:Uncharacterized protein n=1 Tax=Meloidogyne graminicola TaxID=189291 RepID=A0A8S9ZN58_9BILA|nr:hypothetical protein Mgra_00005748 [Meloidogyne graminicola]